MATPAQVYCIYNGGAPLCQLTPCSLAPAWVLQKALAERGDALQHKERSLSEAARAAEQRASSLAAREGKVQGLEAQLAQLQAERGSLQLKQEVLASTEAEVGQLKLLDAHMVSLGTACSSPTEEL